MTRNENKRKISQKEVYQYLQTKVDPKKTAQLPWKKGCRAIQKNKSLMEVARRLATQ